MKYIAALFLSGIFFTSLAQGPAQLPRTPINQGQATPPPNIQEPKNELGLNAEQKQKMKELHLKLMKEVLPLKNELNEKEARLQTVRTSDNPDLTQLNSILDDIGRIKTNIAKRREFMMLELRKILNEDQRVLFDSNRKAFMKKAHHRPHNGGKGKRGHHHTGRFQGPGPEEGLGN